MKYVNLLVFAIILNSPTLAQTAEPATGQRVMVIRWKAEMGTDNSVNSVAHLGDVFAVDGVRGEFLWLPAKHAWIRKIDVVPAAEAIDHFTAQIQQQRKPDSYQQRGTAFAALGQYDQAISDLGKAIELDGSLAGLYSSRGDVWRAKGDADRAIADYSQAIKRNSKDARFLVNRSLARADKLDFKTAIADCDAALVLDPNHVEAYINRGVCWRELGEFDRAINDYAAAIKLSPKNAVAYGNRGYAWKHKGEFAKAVSDYERSLELDAASADVHNDLAWLLATCSDKQFRDGDRAMEHARIACELSKFKDWNQLDTLAAACAAAGKYADALTWVQQSLRLAPDSEKPGLQKHLTSFESKRPL